MVQEQIDIRKMNEELNILKKQVAELTRFIKEDLEFARRIDEAWKRYDKGEFISIKKEDFLKELDKW